MFRESGGHEVKGTGPSWPPKSECRRPEEAAQQGTRREEVFTPNCV